MTVPAQTPVANHIGNGVTTTFPYTFLLYDESDLTVTVDNVAKVLGIDYTVTGLDEVTGGNVIFAAAPAALSSVALLRQVAISRDTDYQYSGDFQSPTVNRDFDRLVMMIQDSGIAVANALRFPPGDASDGFLPVAALRALNVLGFDAEGNIVLAPTVSGDATGLTLALASSSTLLQGAAMVGFNEALSYAPGSIGAHFNDMASVTDAAKGAVLVGYKPSFAGAVGRPLSDKLEETVSVKDFGASPAASAATNRAAFQAAIDYLDTQGGGTLQIPRGQYDIDAQLVLTNVDNLRIAGEGSNVSIIRTTSATANVFYSNSSNIYNCYEDFCITSSVTRTAGAYFDLLFEKRAMFRRLRMQKHANCMILRGFEVCVMDACYIVSPTGAGVSLIAGTSSGSNTGANLTIKDCFFRGNDDINTTSDPVAGSGGMLVYDVEAIFCINTDFGVYDTHAVQVVPSTRSANMYFLQTYFDVTKSGYCFVSGGTGLKAQFTFTGCWFASAGKWTGGSPDMHGCYITNTGTYSDWQFTGCRFFNNISDGVLIEYPAGGFNFSGCQFISNGAGASVHKNGLHIAPTTTQVVPVAVTGCQFQNNGVADIRVETLGRGNIITGNTLPLGLSWAVGAFFGNCAGNYDGTTDIYASATDMQLTPTKDYYGISGTTNINGIKGTYPGHKIALKFAGALTVVDDALNLRLSANFVTVTNSMLHLICETNGEWRELSRINT